LQLKPGRKLVNGAGRSHPGSGEAVKIIVVKRDPLLTVEDLNAHGRKYLTAYKIPRIVEFRKELPKTNLGKILRRGLREPPTI
jgi:long-chain acyl-CoA synthetase